MPKALNKRLQSPYMPSAFYIKHGISMIITAINIQSPTMLFRLITG